MVNRIYSLLSLATKAGRLVSGEFSCERVIKSGKTNLIIIAEDASDNTKKKFRDKASYRGIEIREFGEKELLGKYIGKGFRTVIAITDSGFAKRLIEMTDSLSQEHGGV